MVFVQWEELSRDQWDKLVEALLYRMYADGRNQVHVYDGSGGDGGRDVVVIRPDGYTMIFQLKHFPYGYSGPYGSRRAQITKSFKAAMKHDPDEWILVVPHKLKAGERTFNEKLRRFKTTAKPMKICEMGETQLNSELARFPDLRQAFDRKDWERFKQLWDIDRRVLPGTPTEVAERVAATQESIDAADNDWKWQYSNVSGRQVMTLVAKHFKAYESSPVDIQIYTDTSTASPELRERIRAVWGFGLDQQIELPEEMVDRLVVNGPPIAAQDLANVRLIFGVGTSVPELHRRAAVRTTKGGRTLSVTEGRVEHAQSGTIGVSLRIRMYNILTVVVLLPNDPHAAVSTEVNPNFVDAALSDLVSAGDFL